MKSEIEKLIISHENLESRIDRLRLDVDYLKSQIESNKSLKSNYNVKSYTMQEFDNQVSEPSIQYQQKKNDYSFGGFPFSFLLAIITVGILIDIYGASSTYLLIGFVIMFIFIQSIIVALNLSLKR